MVFTIFFFLSYLVNTFGFLWWRYISHVDILNFIYTCLWLSRRLGSLLVRCLSEVCHQLRHLLPLEKEYWDEYEGYHTQK